MITAALDFIHGRKWIVEAIALAAIMGLVAWWHHATFEAGIKHQKAEDDEATASLVHAAEVQTDFYKARAERAEGAHAQETIDNDRYRAANPLHGGLCQPAYGWQGHLPDVTATHAGNAGASPGPAAIQPVPAGDTESGGRANPDIRHLLDLLAGRADEVSATLREFQAR